MVSAIPQGQLCADYFLAGSTNFPDSLLVA